MASKWHGGGDAWDLRVANVRLGGEGVQNKEGRMGSVTHMVLSPRHARMADGEDEGSSAFGSTMVR